MGVPHDDARPRLLDAVGTPRPDDSFVAENYHALRERGAFAAGVPAELGGGAGFYRSTGLERCFRDLQGVRYHPLTEKGQTDLTGRVLLGLSFDA